MLARTLNVKFTNHWTPCEAIAQKFLWFKRNIGKKILIEWILLIIRNKKKKKKASRKKTDSSYCAQVISYHVIFEFPVSISRDRWWGLQPFSPNGIRMCFLSASDWPSFYHPPTLVVNRSATDVSPSPPVRLTASSSPRITARWTSTRGRASQVSCVAASSER